MAFGRRVLGPLLNDMSERNILSMTYGRGHIFNVVSVGCTAKGAEIVWCQSKERKVITPDDHHPTSTLPSPSGFSIYKKNSAGCTNNSADEQTNKRINK